MDIAGRESGKESITELLIDESSSEQEEVSRVPPIKVDEASVVPKSLNASVNQDSSRLLLPPKTAGSAKNLLLSNPQTSVSRSRHSHRRNKSGASGAIDSFYGTESSSEYPSEAPQRPEWSLSIDKLEMQAMQEARKNELQLQ